MTRSPRPCLSLSVPGNVRVGRSETWLPYAARPRVVTAENFTLLFGRVADLFGRRRIFLAGIALLGVSSLIGGLAETPEVLLIARVAQGLATAAVTPAALSLLTTSFREGPLRDRVLGLNGALMAAGFTTGAILGGVLTDGLSWRWAFFINVVVAVGVLATAPAVLSESRPARRPALDVPGAVTVPLGLLAIVYGLTTAGERSWTHPWALVALAVGVVLLGAFWLVEKRGGAPLVPVAILRRSNIGWGNLAGLLAFATETSLVFLLTLYLQQVLGYSALAAGLSFAVLGVGTVLGGILGPKLIGRIGSKKTLVLGFLTQAVATLPLVLLSPNPTWIIGLLITTFAGGVANLVAIVGFMVTATSGLPDGDQGLATGLTTMSQQVGITLGTPIMSTIATGTMHALGTQTTETVLTGITTAIAANAGLASIAALLIGIFLRQPGRDRVQQDVVSNGVPAGTARPGPSTSPA